MTNEQLASSILEAIGGKENVVVAMNCMTRLRIKLKDPNKADIQALKKIEGVLGVVEEETLQVVLGPGKAKKVRDEFVIVSELNDEKGSDSIQNDWQANKQAVKSGQKKSALKDALSNIANIFIPLMPAIIAAGLFSGLASLLSQTGVGKEQVQNQTGSLFVLITLFQLIGGGFLGYFAIYTGINAANRFGATQALGGMIGAMSIMPQIVTLSTTFGLYNKETPLDSILTTGKGGIIGVIFGVWILSKVEKRIRKAIPDTLDLIVTPFASLLVTALLLVFAIMPAAGVLSDMLVSVLSLLISSTNPVVAVISGYILSALFLPMVLLGLHHGLIPIYAIQLQTVGTVSLFPVLAMAGAGQVGAALAIYLKAKRVGNTRLKMVITGALPAGFLGVGEPLIYGVTLPLGKPFITAGIGAGFGGAFAQLMQVSSVAWGPSGLVAIPLMSTPAKMLYYFVGLIISYVMGFVVTAVAIKDDDVKNA